MTSPYRDRNRAGGWIPWRERLKVAMTMPGERFEWIMGSDGAARTTACYLRSGMIHKPPGRWLFEVRGSTIRAVFLGP